MCHKTVINGTPLTFDYLTINVALILKVLEVIFYADKTHNRPFQGVFRGGQDNFDPKIVLSARRLCKLKIPCAFLLFGT
jgi:hypothetical protein